MKILVISIPRSGSTSLFNALVHSSERIKLDPYLEPYNPAMDKYIGKNIDFNGNCILKTIVHHKPLGISWKDFYGQLIERFDKVILLSRKNKVEVLESLGFASYVDRLKKKHDWHTKYRYDDIKDIPLEKYAGLVDFFYKRLDEIKTLFNLNTYFYEDLFTNSDAGRNILLKELEIEVNMEKFNTFFDLKNKYRQ